MNKNKSIERKKTTESSDQSDSNPRVEIKNPYNRISSLKNVSLKDIPFSQHIFNQTPAQELKVMSATNFKPQRWSFEPRWDIMQKEFEDKSKEIESKNRFFQVRMAYLNKDKEKKTLQKRNSVIEEVDHELLDDKVTFRNIKKSYKNQSPEEVKLEI